MSPLVHVGIEYSDLGPRIAVLAEGRLHRIDLPIGEQIVLDPRNVPPLGVGFPGLFRMIGAPEAINADHVLRDLLALVRRIVEERFRRRLGRLVVAVPTGLMSLRRAVLVGSAQAAGFEDVELIDVSIPAALAYSGSADAPTNQLVYYLGYGECEYALLRVVRGRVKVLGSGITATVSGQSFDVQLMEAVIRALQEKSVFLGLAGFRNSQWLQFRKIVAKAREELAKRPTTELTLPPTLVRDGGTVRVTLSGKGFAARIAAAIRGTIDDVCALLEENEIKPGEIDAVVALGDTATKYPVTPLLAEAFPGKLLVGDIGIVAAAAAAYSASLERKPTDAAGPEFDLSYYLSPYEAAKGLPLGPTDGGAEPIVTAVAVDHLAPGARASEAAAAVAPAAEAGSGSVSTVAAAKELIERGRSLIEEARQLLQGIGSDEAAAEEKPEEADTSGADVLMDQAESMVSRGLYAEAVNLAHRAYEEARLDGSILARMLRVHVDASLAFEKPEEYGRAIEVLMCAHSHDRTDQSVHRALAARHFRHAQEMHERDARAAMQAAQDALRFDPKHEDARALFDTLCAATKKAD